MNKVNLLFTLLLLPALLDAQELKPFKAYKYNSKKTESLFYSNTSMTAGGVSHNQYVIVSDKSAKDTVFMIDLVYNMPAGQIDVQQVNMRSKLTSSRKISFRPPPEESDTLGTVPNYCVKNYVVFDTTLTVSSPDSAREDILFTVVDVSAGTISLHQLKTFDSLYHFPLDKFRKSYLASHLEHSALYWQWRDQQVQDSIRKTQETHRMLLAIKMEKGRFTKQVDSLMNDIYAKQSAAAVDVLRADTNALTSFRKRMDKILTDNLFETHPFNTKTSGTYAVVVKDNNVIDIVEKPTKKTTDPIFLAYYQSPLYEVESQISNIKLDRRKVGINVDSAYRSLLYQQKSRISRAKLDSAFLKTFTDSVYTALTPYRKQVDMPTSYDYKFSYSSSSAWQRWGKRGEKYKNLKTGENIDNLKLINDFHARQKNTKNGKYQVRVNKSQLNDSIFGPHIDSVYRKYKYLTHIGFNVGVIITGDEFSTEGKTIDKGLLYFDFFVIYHHFGAFGGFASKSVLDESDLDGYSEGGLYVAPGNYFFFKLGLASFNGKISGLLGGTLVFPFVQFEGGYNFALKRAYVMAGVNIPINR